MAKNKAKQKAKQKAPAAPAVQGLEAFQRGQYPQAKAELGAVPQDNDRPEGERKLAADLLAATGVEKGARWTALACLALYGIIVLVTILKQPA